jgi:hypothetical protein
MQRFRQQVDPNDRRSNPVWRWILPAACLLGALAFLAMGFAAGRSVMTEAARAGAEQGRVERIEPVASNGKAAPGGDEAIVLGEEEPVELSAEDGGESIEVLAKVDTGAGYSSIDEDLADELDIDLEGAETVDIRSANGKEERPLVPVRIKVAGKELNTRVTVADRDGLSKDMLLGSNDLEGFLVKTGEEQLTSPDSETVENPVAALLEFPPPPPSAPMLLAALPLAAAAIVAARTLVGLKTFGLFAPVLLAIAFVQTGLPAGLVILGSMLAAGMLVMPLLRPLRLPRVARLAVLLTVVSALLVGINALIDDPALSSEWASAFPVVVTAVVMERFAEAWEQEGPVDALKALALTLLVAMAASPILVAEPVRWVVERVPLALGIAGAALSVLAGSYRGLRLTEFVRFRPAAEGTVENINAVKTKGA